MLAVSNVYVVLKTGWSLGVALSASILAFSVFRLLALLGLTRRPLSPGENALTGSVASAAAFMTGGGNMAALPALLLLTGARPAGFWMFLWFLSLAALGVLSAIPLKRSIIDRDALPFPSSVATAETIRVMHSGATEKGEARGGRILGLTSLGAGAATLLRDLPAALGPALFPGKLGLPFSFAGVPAARLSLAFELSPVLLGGGALMGFRTGCSMLLGALIGYGWLAPRWIASGVITKVDFKSISTWTLWPGAALLVTSGVLSFALGGHSFGRSLLDLGTVFRRGRQPTPEAERTDAPRSWFVAGFLLLSPVVVVLMRQLFGVPVWAGVLSLLLALPMAVVAARVNGETDISPTKALGPLTQLIFGALLPGHLTANLMSANVTGGVGLHAADLLADVKMGNRLGVTARAQVVAQLFGVVAGALVVVPAFGLLVADPGVLGSERFPAPAVMVWAGVSQALAKGLSALPSDVRTITAAFGLAGALVAVVERFAPESVRRVVPSAAGLGIALVMPASSSITMFAGATLALLARRFAPEHARRGLVPAASGLIVGESLVGVGLALLRSLGFG